MVKKEEFESATREALYWRALCIRSVLKKDVGMGKVNMSLLLALSRGISQEQVDAEMKIAKEAMDEANIVR